MQYISQDMMRAKRRFDAAGRPLCLQDTHRRAILQAEASRRAKAASDSRTQRTLDLSAFAKGSYTLLVEHDGQRVSQAVVVE